ncbi:hypothetical protein SHKM778_83290 [Streptomyces sp. KM77-8]|uniref:Uncharacterized protein n=1 Tax=Streptomyces haneummycinicus TaxID=3074435 RepID=A0AAT9HXW6_9ACTN
MYPSATASAADTTSWNSNPVPTAMADMSMSYFAPPPGDVYANSGTPYPTMPVANTSYPLYEEYGAGPSTPRAAPEPSSSRHHTKRPAGHTSGGNKRGRRT